MPWYQVTIKTVFGKTTTGVKEAEIIGESPFAYFSRLAQGGVGSYILRGLEIEDLDSNDPRVLEHKRAHEVSPHQKRPIFGKR